MAAIVTAPQDMSGSGSPDSLVDVRGLEVGYALRGGILALGASRLRAVDGVDLLIVRGHSVGLVGETGSGKSTIAQVIAGVVRPSAGSITAGGQLAPHASKHGSSLADVDPGAIQFVLQDPFSSLNPRMKVRDIIAEPLTVTRTLPRREWNDRVRELLVLVGLPPAKADAYPHEFSGGQRQRIALARALISNPSLIVLDEPTSALDVSVRAQILNLLRDIQDRLGVTYLIISHDLITVAYLATTLVVMHLGRFVETGPTDAVISLPSHPYTVELLSSVPRAGATFLRSRRDAVPVEVKEGCRYAPRCARREAMGNPEVCVTVDPRLVAIGQDRKVACHFPGST